MGISGSDLQRPLPHRQPRGASVKGDAYEGLLEKNAQDTKSGAGQYFTPRATHDHPWRISAHHACPASLGTNV